MESTPNYRLAVRVGQTVALELCEVKRMADVDGRRVQVRHDVEASGVGCVAEAVEAVAGAQLAARVIVRIISYVAAVLAVGDGG